VTRREPCLQERPFYWEYRRGARGAERPGGRALQLGKTGTNKRVTQRLPTGNEIDQPNGHDGQTLSRSALSGLPIGDPELECGP